MWSSIRARAKSIITVVSLFGICTSQAQTVSQSLDDKTGLVQIEIAGVQALNIQYMFWSANYKWASLDVKSSGQPEKTVYTQGKNEPLSFTMSSQSTLTSAASGMTDWEFRATRDVEDVIGGGLAIRFNLAGFGDQLGEPQITSDKLGFRWGKAPGIQFEFRFNRELAAIYLEPGRRNEIRALFYSKRVPLGEARWRMSWSVSGAPMMLKAGSGGTADWRPDPLHLGMPALDLRRTVPLGEGGGKSLRRIRNKGGDLITDDGQPILFWGTNITAAALFATPSAEIRRQARRLASLGYNLVRLHHHDSHWVQPNVLTGAIKRDGQLLLKNEQMDVLDQWVHALREEGIYVWLDLHVQRAFDEDDQIVSLDEVRRGNTKGEAKGFNYVNPSIQAAMRRFAKAYLSHVNPHTGIAYKDDPAVLAVLLTNENDLTVHFGNALLANKGVPWHHQRLADAADAYSIRTRIPRDALFRTWEHGASKFFLNDLEARSHAADRAFLTELGYQGIVVGGSTWGENPLSALPALTAGDMIDVHSYSGEGTLRRDPNYGANLAHWIGAAQVLGLPLSVSEWNGTPVGLQDRHVLPLYLAAVGAHQGWDAMLHYAYTQVPPDRDRVSNWHAFNDPSLLATMPAAALLFRERHVQPARKDYVVDLSAEELTGKAWSPSNSPAMRLAMTHGRLSVAMPSTDKWPWLKRVSPSQAATLIKDPATVPKDLPRSGESDTGELVHDWARGVYIIRTPRTRAALGELGDKDIDAAGVWMRWKTSQLSVAVQSLDERPVESSEDVLISLGTRSMPQPGGRTPFLVEPAKGEMEIPCAAGLRLWAPDVDGGWDSKPMQRKGGRCQVILDGVAPILWLRLSATKPRSAQSPIN